MGTHTKGATATIIGAFLVIGGIMALVYVINIITNPWINFTFGFDRCRCGGWGGYDCVWLSGLIVASIISIIVGIIVGIKGIISLKK